MCMVIVGIKMGCGFNWGQLSDNLRSFPLSINDKNCWGSKSLVASSFAYLKWLCLPSLSWMTEGREEGTPCITQL